MSRPGVATCLLLSLLVLLLAPAVVHGAEREWPAPTGYDLQLRFDGARHALVGSETVGVANTGPAAIDHVWLRVWANGLGGCEARAAQVQVLPPAAAVEEAAACTALRVALPVPLEPGATTTVQLLLEVTVPTVNDRFGRSGGAWMIGNAIPLLAMQDEHGLRLAPYTGLGESFYSAAAPWRLVLDVPAGLEVAATGSETAPREPLGDGGYRIVSETPRARDMAIAIGPFAAIARQVGNVRIRVLRLRSAPRAAGQRLMQDAARAVRRYGQAYGPLGATPGAPTELDVVEARFGDFGGMEYPELVMTVDDDSSVFHEIAHQWFYGLVGSDQYREPWLDESFATFANRRLDGTLRACNARWPLRQFPGVSLTAPMSFWDRHPGDYAAVYDGGACALESLRRGLGPARFGALLRRYVRLHRMGVATTADFVALVRAVAPARFDVAGWLRRSRIHV